MKNEKNKQQAKNEKWFAPFLIVALTWGFAAAFRTTDMGVIIVLIVAIAAGFFYRRVKAKVKNMALTVIVIELTAAGCIGVLTSIANHLF